MSAMWWGLIIGAVFGAVAWGTPAALVLGFLGWLTGVVIDSRRNRPKATKPIAPTPPLDRIGQLESRVKELEERLARLEGSSPSPLGEGRGGGQVGAELEQPTPQPPPKGGGESLLSPPKGGGESLLSPPKEEEEPGFSPSPLGEGRGVGPPPLPASPIATQPNPLLAWLTGGNAIARVGVVVLFIGVAFLLRYAVDAQILSPAVRVAGVAFAAFVLLGIGWRLRDSRPGYALSLQGAGIGLLYLTTYGALRLYGMLPEGVAFALLVAIAALATILAVRQDSAPLAGLGAAGGFLAPVLASAGPGEPAALFGYYAVLDVAILATAWFRRWRSLNFIGFIFTFALGLIWGVEYYRPEHFATVEPFLVFFFLLFVTVAVLFARGEAQPTARLIDAAIVFGVPIAALSLQAGLLDGDKKQLTLSSTALSIFYATGSYLLARQPRAGWQALGRAFFVLAVLFATVTIPLALEARWTSAAWAIEGAALAWYGVQQERKWAVGFGILVQVLAGAAHFAGEGRHAGEIPIANGAFLGAFLIAASGLASHWALRRAASAFSSPAFAWSIVWWVVATFTEASRFLTRPDEISAQLAVTAATALAFAACHARLAWREAAWPSELMVPAMLLFLIAEALGAAPHPFAGWGWAAWIFAAVAHLLARRWVEAPRGLVAGSGGLVHHALFVLVMVAMLGWEAHWQVIDAGLRRSGWASPSLVVVPAAAMLLVSLPILSNRWPISAHAAAYQRTAMIPIAVVLWIWMLAINGLHNGRSQPWPYIPILNSVDLGHLVVLSAMWTWWRGLGRSNLEPPAILRGTGLALAAGAAAFAWANGILLRSLHHWADVAYRIDAWMRSFITQASLSILWSAIAVALMVWATRRGLRALWMVGTALMAVVVAKLLFVDFAHLGGLERVASFIGVGVLMLVVGYLAPVPPKAAAPD
jgi:uncharacterized membrane protein